MIYCQRTINIALFLGAFSGLFGLQGCTQHGHGTLSKPMPTIVAPDPDNGSWAKLDVPSGSIGASAWSPDHKYLAAEIMVAPPAGASQDDSEQFVVIEDMATHKVCRLPDTVHSPLAWLPSGRMLVAGNTTGDNETPGIAWIGLDGVITRSVTLPDDISNVLCITPLDADQEVAFIAQRETKNGVTSAVYTTSGTEIETFAESDDVDLDGLYCLNSATGSKLFWTRWTAEADKVSIELYSISVNNPDKAPRLLSSSTIAMAAGNKDADADAEVTSVTFSPDGGMVAITCGILVQGASADAPPAYKQGNYLIDVHTGVCKTVLPVIALDDDLFNVWAATGQKFASTEMIAGNLQLDLWTRDGAGPTRVPYPAQ